MEDPEQLVDVIAGEIMVGKKRKKDSASSMLSQELGQGILVLNEDLNMFRLIYSKVESTRSGYYTTLCCSDAMAKSPWNYLPVLVVDKIPGPQPPISINMELISLALFANRNPPCAVDKALVSVGVGPSMLVTTGILQPQVGGHCRRRISVRVIEEHT